MMKTTVEKIRAAVIGGGAFGETHLRTFKGMPQIDVAGVYTLEASRGEALATVYGGKSYRDLSELVDDASVDLVMIATPENHHLEPFTRMIDAGKAVYVEKPLATSLEEARKMLEGARKGIAMSGHCLRFEQRLAAVFARLTGVKRHHLSFRNRRTRLEKETYGRVHPAYSMLCHELDLSNAFAESPFLRVMAMETKYSEGQVDGMTILIEYENGVTSSVEGGWYLPRQDGCIEDDFVSIVSAAGVDELKIPHQGYVHIGPKGVEIPNLFYGNTVYGVEYGPLRAAFDYMVQCILTQTQPTISTIADAYAAVELVGAALLSARESRWVRREEICVR
jgi:UDP-N-acetylglucosamine 3-dehydrogenase